MADEAVTSKVAAALNAFRKKVPQPAAYPVTLIDNVAADLRRNGVTGSPIAIFGAAVQGMDSSWTALKVARSLALGGRVILVGVSSADAAIRAASADPSASGLADLAAGAASFRDIITKDRQTDLHLISSGRTPTDRGAILASSGIATSFQALSRSYEYVVVAAGTIVGHELEVIGTIAPHAIMVAGTMTSAGIAAARERLLGAGFEDVTVVVEAAATDAGPTAVAA